MNIVIDGRTLGWTGIGRYGRYLIEQLEHLDHTNTYVVLVQRKDWQRWEPGAANFSKHEVNIEPYTLGEQLQLGRVLNKLKPDLVHFLSFNSPVFYFGRRVTTVHDLTLIDYRNRPGLIYQLKRVVMKRIFRQVLRHSAKVITDAQFIADQLVRRGYIPRDRVTAIHLGAPALPSQASPTKKTPTLLYVGNLYPYKNLDRLLAAMPKLHEAHPGSRLVIVGQRDIYATTLEQQATKLGIRDAIEIPGYVTDEQLAAFYHQAALYVFPSLSEGFGLPPLEAMSLGLPVAASNASCIPEVLGDAAVYFDPHDVDSIAAVISSTLSDPKRLKELQVAGRAHLKDFSWERMAVQTLEVYNEVLGDK